MTRSYSDPSYGAKKQNRFGIWSCGTRSAATVESISMMSPFEITDVSMKAIAAGSGSTCEWILKAGTTVISTISFATNVTADTVVNATATSYQADADTLVNLVSGTQIADPAQTFELSFEYVERFVESDT